MIRKSDSTDLDNQLTSFQTPSYFKQSPHSAFKSPMDVKQPQVPKYTPKRVMGNGAFGKYNFTLNFNNQICRLRIRSYRREQTTTSCPQEDTESWQRGLPWVWDPQLTVGLSQRDPDGQLFLLDERLKQAYLEHCHGVLRLQSGGQTPLCWEEQEADVYGGDQGLHEADLQRPKAHARIGYRAPRSQAWEHFA